VGFYDTHVLAKKKKPKGLKPLSYVIAGLRKKGYQAARTHFAENGIRTNAPQKIIEKLI